MNAYERVFRSKAKLFSRFVDEDDDVNSDKALFTIGLGVDRKVKNIEFRNLNKFNKRRKNNINVCVEFVSKIKTDERQCKNHIIFE